MNTQDLQKLKEMHDAMPAAPYGYSYGSTYLCRKTDNSYHYIAQAPAGKEDSEEWNNNAAYLHALLDAAPELIALAEKSLAAPTVAGAVLSDEQILQTWAQYRTSSVAKGGMIPDPIEFAHAILAAAAPLYAAAQASLDNQDSHHTGTLYQAVQRAADQLPEGFTIRIEIERNAGTVELSGDDGEWALIDGNDGYMCQAVNEAIDIAINSTTGDAAIGEKGNG